MKVVLRYTDPKSEALERAYFTRDDETFEEISCEVILWLSFHRDSFNLFVNETKIQDDTTIQETELTDENNYIDIVINPEYVFIERIIRRHPKADTSNLGLKRLAIENTKKPVEEVRDVIELLKLRYSESDLLEIFKEFLTKGSLENFDMILEYIDVNSSFPKNGYVYPLLNFAIFTTLCLERVKIVLKHKPNLEARSSAGDTAFLLAAVNNFHSAMDELISTGSKVDECNFRGYTALQFASGHKEYSLETQKKLISMGANLEHKDDRENTPLIYACINFVDVDRISTLLEAGARIDAINYIRKTAFDYLFEKHNHIAMSMFVEFGLRDPRAIRTMVVGDRLYLLMFLLQNDINHADDEGNTALHHAIEKRRPRMVKYLLLAGIDTNIKNRYGKLALDGLFSNVQKEVIKFLHKNDRVSELDDHEKIPL